MSKPRMKDYIISLIFIIIMVASTMMALNMSYTVMANNPNDAHVFSYSWQYVAAIIIVLGTSALLHKSLMVGLFNAFIGFFVITTMLFPVTLIIVLTLNMTLLISVSVISLIIGMVILTFSTNSFKASWAEKNKTSHDTITPVLS